MSQEFWDYLQRLVETNKIVIDRPAGSTHPRYERGKYPVDYGYLEGTTAIDGGGVDIWVGSLQERRVVGIVCTVDLFKRDTELKILIDCKDDEIAAIMNYINQDTMRAIYLKRE